MGLSAREQNQPPVSGKPDFVPWHRRWLSGVIDALLVGMVFGLWMIVVRTSPEWIGPRPDELGTGLGYAESIETRRNISRSLVAAMLTTTAVVALANTVIAQGISGRTLGKLITGQRLIDAGTGRPVGVGRALLRQLAHILDALPCYLGFFWPLVDEQRRTFADIVAGTVAVENERTPERDHRSASPRVDARLFETGAPVTGTGRQAERDSSVGEWNLLNWVGEAGQLPATEVRRIGIGVAYRLAERHAAGHVHGGLAPSTVTGTAYSVDIGPVVPLTDAAGYTAPEVAAGAPVDPAADVFALGAVLVFAATGSGPYGIGSPTQLLGRVSTRPPTTTGVPDDLLPVIQDCLSGSPAQRPAAAQVAARLSTGTAIPTAPSAPTDPGHTAGDPVQPETHPDADTRTRKSLVLSRVARRRNLVAAGLATVVVVLATVIFVSIPGNWTDTSAPRATTSTSVPPKTLELGGVVAIALSPDGRHAYVSEPPATQASTTVTVAVVDTATTSVLTRIRVEANSSLKALTASPDGTRLYGVAWGALLVIDTASQRLLETVDMVTGSKTGVNYVDNSGVRRAEDLDVSISFDDLAISADGRRIYAAGGSGDRIWMYDTETRQNSVSAPLAQINNIALSADGRRIYAGALLEDVNLTQAAIALDAFTLAEINRFPAGTGAWITVTTAPDNVHLYWIATGGSAEVVRVDTRTGASTPLGRVDLNVDELVPSPSGRYLFVAHHGETNSSRYRDGITVFDTHSGQVVHRIDTDFTPGPVALSPDGRRLYIGSKYRSYNPVTGRFTFIDVSDYP